MSGCTVNTGWMVDRVSDEWLYCKHWLDGG